MNSKTSHRFITVNKGMPGSKFRSVYTKSEDITPPAAKHVHHDVTATKGDGRIGGFTRFSELLPETRTQLRPSLLKKSTLAVSRIQEGVPAGLKLLGAMDALGFSAHINPGKVRI